MKQFLIILALIPFGSRVNSQPGLEVHCSVNRPFGHSEKNTYYGGGIGANVLFRDTSVFSLKIGLEVNYFHALDGRTYRSKMYSRKDFHYQYAVVTFPAFARFTFGKRVKFFLEAGGYVGVLGGNIRYTVTSYPSSPGQSLKTSEKNDSYYPGLFLSPAASLGLRFPLSERLDLFVKPEFAFVKNWRLFGGEGSGYGAYSFSYSYLCARLCVGLHLKPR